MPPVFCCAAVKPSDGEEHSSNTVCMQYIVWAVDNAAEHSRVSCTTPEDASDGAPSVVIKVTPLIDDNSHRAERYFALVEDDKHIYKEGLEDVSLCTDENLDQTMTLICDIHHISFKLESYQSKSEEEVHAISSALESLAFNAIENGIVDSEAGIVQLVDQLHSLPTHPPSLYIDIEGIDLSRHGQVSIIQIHSLPQSQTYLVDVHVLEDQTFTIEGKKGLSLKDILESSLIPKVFFDVRNDSNALYFLYGIKLDCVHDLQLMELATRTFSKRCVNGLARCIENDARMSYTEKTTWSTVKQKGRKLFAPELGGSYDVFNCRPLSADIQSYCEQDVQFLPRLWSYYDGRMSASWKSRVLEASKERVRLSQQERFNGKGRHMALAPTGWA